MYGFARRLSVSIALAATALTGTVTPASAQIPYLQLPTSEPKYAAIVMDATTGEVLYDKRADSPRYPASITKVMTLYLTFEQLASGKLQLDDPVIISPRAAAQPPTKIGLRAGETISVRDAMSALATKSANDIAVALAEKIGGSESRFAALMTLRARELGMLNTHFANASGLPDSRQISTAHDIAILSRAIMRDYPQYYSLFSTQEFAFRGQTIRNHNRLLGKVPGVDGIKTGFTNASGYNIAVSGVQDGRRLITVVLGGSSGRARDNNAEQLLLTGFDVARRRDRGEHIELATAFDAPRMGPYVTRSTAQGDRDEKNMVTLVKPKTQAAVQAVSKPKKPAGEWTVQVGAFKTRKEANQQLSLVAKRFDYFDAGKREANKSGDFYRARFEGLSERQAKDGCKAVKAKKMPCMVVSPA
ncbi:MAG: D-alanyl-D-alanine carboxypeptidase [Caulobacteraceae bacterium]|nr:D-alanyl-D-alanine carboxypeptidase [Caulobacteraceae bacterium]